MITNKIKAHLDWTTARSALSWSSRLIYKAFSVSRRLKRENLNTKKNQENHHSRSFAGRHRSDGTANGRMLVVVFFITTTKISMQRSKKVHMVISRDCHKFNTLRRLNRGLWKDTLFTVWGLKWSRTFATKINPVSRLNTARKKIVY